GRGHTRVVAAVTQPGHRAVRLVPAAPVPEVARARAVHLDDLAPAVHRDGGAAAGVALVERTGPGVAGQHREDAAAQLAHGRRGGRVVRGAQQLVAEHAGERVVERGQVAGGVRGVVGQVVLDVERDGDGRR